MTAQHTTPDFKGPRRSGDRFAPDSRGPLSTSPRGTYPQDSGGPPETRVGRYGPQGDSMTPAAPANKQVDRKPPRKTTAGNTSTNPIK